MLTRSLATFLRRGGHHRGLGGGCGCLNARQTQRGLIVPPGIGEPVRTNQEVIKSVADVVVGGPNTYDPAGYQGARIKLQEQIKSLPQSQSELPARRMSDSFEHSVIPLGSDRKLRDKYMTHMNSIRIGRLLEDMDIFAVYLVFKHINLTRTDTVQSPFSIVTALVDRIGVTQKIEADQDVKLSGHVTWVGRSSAESTLHVHQMRDKQWEKVMEARFVIVARDALNRGSVVINPLVAETAEEKALLIKGQGHAAARRGKAKDSLFQSPPSEEEKAIIHDFFIRTVDHTAKTFKARVKPEHSVWMEDAKLKNVIICQPENRNVFNKIFGGFIMRQSFELAWACAYVHGGKRRPYIQYMDDILFEKPVEVGSLLYFNSQVAYTHGNYVQVRVGAEALDPNTKSLQSTNVFHYTFLLRGDEPAPTIIPKTYHEAMMYLNARRHFLACHDAMPTPDIVAV